MSVIELTAIKPATSWDRGPDQTRARYLAQLYRRRERLLEHGRHLLAAPAPRHAALVLRRMGKVSALHREYDQISHRILDIELF